VTDLLRGDLHKAIYMGENPVDKALHETVKSDVASQPLAISEDGDVVLLGYFRFLTARITVESDNLMKILTALKR
jgi:hypothetical protein